MDEALKKRLPPVQTTALELLDCFVAICEKYSYKYVLAKETAMGIHLNKGFMPWVSSATIILEYNELKAFIKVCEKELNGTPYYLITRDNTEQFDEFYIRMAKKSKVKLGMEREKDEKYYDYFIDILPAFYAGNSVKEYKQIEKAYIRYYNILNSRCLTQGALKTGRKIKDKLMSAYYYSQKKSDDFTNTEAILKSFTKPTKFLYVPNEKKNKRSTREAVQYMERRLYEFEGRQYYSVFDIERYLTDLYGMNYQKNSENERINQALLEGPEILRRVQLIELDMLIEFDRICREHDIKYILGAGTLLGAVRHKGFIPWDDDIDVFMLYGEYKKFINIANKELDKEKYFLKTQDSDLDNNLTFTQLKRNGTKYLKGDREKFNTHPGVYIDIHPLFNAPASSLGYWFQDRICKFFKTTTWAHMGAESEKNIVKRQCYRILAKVSNKTSYRLFMRYATKVKKPSEKLSCFYILRNFPENPVNERRIHENIVELEFEGHTFYTTKYWDDYLKYSYSKDYMRYPIMIERIPKHMPAIVDAADLFQDIKY